MLSSRSARDHGILDCSAEPLSAERASLSRRQFHRSLFQTSARRPEDVVGGHCKFSAANSACAEAICEKTRQKGEGEEEEEERNGGSISSRSSHPEESRELQANIASLKACIKDRDLQNGTRIHAELLSRGLLHKNISLANTVIRLYAKCGALAKAQEVCENLQSRNAVSWNILIAGYADYGPSEEALKCFERMQLEGLSPDPVSFNGVLKACASIGAADKALELHTQIEKEGLIEKDMVVGTTVVDTFAKLGLLTKAQEVFDKLSNRDSVSWNVLITGHAQHGQGKDALNCLEQMRNQGFSPDDVTFIGSLKACATIGETHMGQELHAEAVKFGLDGSNNAVNNAILDMYAKFGILKEAQSVFEDLCFRDVISFSSLIAGYVQHGQSEEALLCFSQMRSEGVSPNEVTLVSVLKACGSIEGFYGGLQIHSQIVKEGIFEKNTVVSRSLLDMYGSSGLLDEAKKVFEKLPHRDVYSFNLLISTYAQNDHDEQALHYFEQMQDEGLIPNCITLASVLKACTNLGAAEKGQQIYEQIILYHGLEKDLALATTLIDMFASCGLLGKAQEMFDKIHTHDVILWNALINGYTRGGFGEQALNCFEQMKVDDILPDSVTLICVMKACTLTGDVNEGLEIHTQIEKRGFFEGDPVFGTALVDMYAKLSLFIEAEKVLSGLSIKDVITWNVLMTEYAKSGHNEEALSLFEQMQQTGLSADPFTFACALKSCAGFGVVRIAEVMHMNAAKEGLMEEDIVIVHALIDMYSNLGMLGRAQNLFNSLKIQSVVSWNAVTGGYSQLGKVKFVFEVFQKMLAEGINPDNVTLTIVLNTCSHTGHSERCQIFFEAFCNITPTLEHYTCMIDMFGRAGHLEMAVCLLRDMPYFAENSLWLAVLGACQKWGEAKIGRMAFNSAAQYARKDAAAYVSLGNLF